MELPDCPRIGIRIRKKYLQIRNTDLQNRDIRLEANMKRIFIRFEANITGFIRLFRIGANPRILHAKRIKTEANIPF